MAEYPYNLVGCKNLEITADEDDLDLYRYPEDFDIPSWEPAQGLESESLSNKKIAYLDIETSGLDSAKNRILYIGLRCDYPGYQTVIKIFQNRENEGQLIYDFLKFFKKYTPDILVTHNGFNFDLPFIINRAKLYRLSHRFNFASKETTVTSSSHNGRPIVITQVFHPKVDIIDTYVLSGIYDKSANTLPNLRLKDIAIHFGVRDERRLELSFTEMMSCWHKKDDATFIKYLQYDLEDTKGISDILLPVYFYQNKIFEKVSLQYCALSSPAFKWQTIFQDFYGRDFADRIKADPKIKYRGAITGVNPGLYKCCYKIDVSSMYPSIIITYGLHSRKDVKKVGISAMKYLMQYRLAYKQKYKETGDETFNIIQNALKILINGGYGFFGTGFYTFNCMRTATLVTAYGRAIVKLMSAKLKQLNVDIVEIDTDGIICKGGDSTFVLKEVTKILPKGIEIDLDWDNVDIYCPKAKNYILIAQDKITKKGYFKKRDKCKLQLDFSLELVKRALISQESATLYYQETINAIKNRTVDINDLTFTKKIPNYSKPTNNRLVTAGLGNYGDKVTFYEAEEIRWGKPSKKTGKSKQLQSKAKPVIEGDYWIDFYVNIIEVVAYELFLLAFGTHLLVGKKALQKIKTNKLDSVGNIEENLGDLTKYLPDADVS